MPTPGEADALVHVRSAPGWLGPRNAAFLLTLVRRGQRVGALLRLDGRDLHRPPNGSVMMILSAKSSPVPAEFTIPDAVQTDLEPTNSISRQGYILGVLARISANHARAYHADMNQAEGREAKMNAGVIRGPVTDITWLLRR